MKKSYILATSALLISLHAGSSAADNVTNSSTSQNSAASFTDPVIVKDKNNPVLERSTKENNATKTENPFVIAFYKPTYILPFYHTGAPDNAVYAGQIRNNQQLDQNEIKYQISLKVPVWRNIFGSFSSLFLGYTQLSYWQAYNHDPFFRETNYEPELFLQNEVNWHLGGHWLLSYINLGFDHQSNGYGGSMERTWNRVYLSSTFSTDNLMITLKPWYVIKSNSYEQLNPDLTKYLGHGSLTAAYKFNSQVFAIESQNLIESGGKRSGTTLSWSFPLTRYLNGYVQYFTGYGQSLIEYNHRTNSAGIGIALSNWV